MFSIDGMKKCLAVIPTLPNEELKKNLIAYFTASADMHGLIMQYKGADPEEKKIIKQGHEDCKNILQALLAEWKKRLREEAERKKNAVDLIGEYLKVEHLLTPAAIIERR